MNGRDFVLLVHENGLFTGTSPFDRATPAMRIHQEEIFGPVLSVLRAADHEEAWDSAAAVRAPRGERYVSGDSSTPSHRPATMARPISPTPMTDGERFA